MKKTFKNEKDVKDAVKQILTKHGAYYYMVVPVIYSRTGVPDFLICHKGHFIAVETKFGYNKPSERQKEEMRLISRANGISFIINEKNLEELDSYLTLIEQNIDSVDISALEQNSKEMEAMGTK